MAGLGQGYFGPWTVEGDALDSLDVQMLDEGTEVEIVWSGGNGPHRGRIVFDTRSEPYYVTERCWETKDERMWFYNPLGIVGAIPLTEVRKVI